MEAYPPLPTPPRASSEKAEEESAALSEPTGPPAPPHTTTAVDLADEALPQSTTPQAEEHALDPGPDPGLDPGASLEGLSEAELALMLHQSAAPITHVDNEDLSVQVRLGGEGGGYSSAAACK